MIARSFALFRWLCLLTCLQWLSVAARAATGVLLPNGKQSPDPSILSLEEMSVDITIDNGDARVFITQIFLNHTSKIEEGTYNFPLPGGATISDFAVWDGPVRIPAVILERRRAQEVYRDARLQAIDPGLLQMGERDASTPEETALFSAKIVPIPAFGTKRLEIEYHQRIDTSDLQAGFVLPLKPDAQGQQTVHLFKAHLTLHSAQRLATAHLNSGYPFKISQQDSNNLVATLEQKDLNLTEDLSATWTLAPDSAAALTVIAHRDTTPVPPTPDEKSPPPPQPEPGFFQATLLIAQPAPTPAATADHRTLILLFDNSLSMQWDKLERSFAATEAILRSLTPTDRFNLILFNDKTIHLQPLTGPRRSRTDHQGAGLHPCQSSSRRHRHRPGAHRRSRTMRRPAGQHLTRAHHRRQRRPRRDRAHTPDRLLVREAVEGRHAPTAHKRLRRR